MKKKILLLAFAVLFSTVNGFAESTSAYWGRIALLHTNYSNAFSEFKEGAEEGMFADCYGPLAVMYAMGLGTPKNPQLAYKYLKLYEENDGFWYQEKIRFWLDFYLGKEISEWIAYSTFKEVPKVMAFFKSENYTCKAFGQSPDMKKALEFLYARDNLQYSSAKGVLKYEEYSEPFLQYALKENDFKLMKMIDEANPNRFAVFEEKDAENYQNTPKDAESLKKFVDETAITNKWREVAKKEYFDTQLNEVFKDGGFNKELDDLVDDVAREWNKEEEYSAKREEIFDQLLVSYIEAGELEKAKLLANGANENAKLIVDILVACEVIKEHLKSGTMTDVELSGCSRALGSNYSKILNSRYQAYADKKVSDLYNSWDKKTDFTLMGGAFQGKFGDDLRAIKVNETLSWNATTSIDYIHCLLVYFVYDVIANTTVDATFFENNREAIDCLAENYKYSDEGASVLMQYYRVALEATSTWTIDTEVAEMDAVVERPYLNEETKAKVIAAYNQNAIERMNVAKNNKKDIARVYALAKDVKDMKYLTEPKLREQANKMYEKAAKKMK